MVKKRSRRNLLIFFLILFLGLSGLFLTKTDTGFTLLYRILSKQINKNSNYSLSVKELSRSMKAQISAGRLIVANDDSSLVFSVDTLNIHFKGIFELIGKRRLDSLTFIDPHLYIRSPENGEKNKSIGKAIQFPRFLIGRIDFERLSLSIETADTLYSQEIKKASFAYSGQKDAARIFIRDLEVFLPEQNLHISNTRSEISVKNDIAKLRNLSFSVNEAFIEASGKLRYFEAPRFEMDLRVNNISPAKYLNQEMIRENDLLNLHLELMGNFKDFSLTTDMNGTLNGEKIVYANLNLEYKNNFIHLLGASFKSKGTDLSLYGSYNLLDRYVSGSLTAHQLKPSDWFSEAPEFALNGRMRVNGYIDKNLMLNYDWHFGDIYGLPSLGFYGNARIDSMQTILLDSSNVLSLPGGSLKVRGEISDMRMLNVDVYGSMDYFGGLEIPGISSFDSKNLILTLKLLGSVKDPDLQMNLNLDDLYYDKLHLRNLNLSLFGNRILSHPDGALLMSFDHAEFDSLQLGSVETYIRIDNETVVLDYLDLNYDNYDLSMSGSIRNFSDFSLSRMQGSYMNQSVYLLDTVSFSMRDDGFSLSRFDILYRDALLYGSLDVAGDSIWGSLNIAGAQLETLPFISAMGDSLSGVLDFNLDIESYLGDPKMQAQLLLKHAHYQGITAERIRTNLHYEKQRININNFIVDFTQSRSLRLSAAFPTDINFKRINPFKVLTDEAIEAEFGLKNIRLSVLAPILSPDLSLSGELNMRGNLSGSLNDPAIEGEILLAKPGMEKIEADTLKAKMYYKDSYIYFHDASLIANNGRYNGNAYLYTDLRWQPKGPRFSPDSSLYAYLEGSDDELLYLTPFIEDIERFDGDFYTELEIKGSLNKSDKNGRISVKNGRLVLSFLSNKIENLEGDIRLENNIADVDLRGKLPSVSYTLVSVLGLDRGKTESAHNFNVSGSMNMQNLIKPEFDLLVQGDQISVVTLDENFNLNIGNVDLRVKGRDTLRVSGDVTVREGLVEMNFNQPGNMVETGGESRLYSEYNINAVIDKIYFRNQLIDATLYGELLLLKYAADDGVRLSGQLNISQGIFNYWLSVFDLEEGSIVFDQFQGNHELNFTASKQIGGGNRIIASINGPLNNPEIDFIDEDNKLSKAEIIRELTIGELSRGTNTAARTTTALMVLAERPLEQQAQKLGGGVGGLDRIDIKGGEGTYIDSTTALIVGGRIGRNFYLTYEGSQSDPMNIEIEYRINNRISIVGKADEESVSGAFRLRVQY